MSFIQTLCLLAGRLLLGLYFIFPGIRKFTEFDATSQYMATYDVPFIPVLLILTGVLQIGLGAALIIGYKGRLSAFILAGLTLVISIYMHSFWNLPEGADVARETQNFIKNMAIMAGLLMIVGHGTGKFSVDKTRERGQLYY